MTSAAEAAETARPDMAEDADSGWSEEDLSPIRDRAFLYIKEAIIRGEFKAGERLVERVLAEKLNISRTPIREALLRLETQRFVRTVPRRGVIVNDISSSELVEIFMILSALEAMAVRLACQKMTPEMKAKFDDLIARTEDVIAREDYAQAEAVNIDYNRLVGEAARNARLREMLRDLRDYVRAFSRIAFSKRERIMQALKEHRDILVAVRNGEAALAENYAVIHLEKSKKAFLERANRARDASGAD